MKIRLAQWLAIGLVFVAPTGCGDERTITGGGSDCWMAVDLIYETGMAVVDTASAGAAFRAYLEYVSDSGVPYPDGAVSWEYDSAEFARDYQGLHYWRICYMRILYEGQEPALKCVMHVDEHGTVVRAQPCI